jgi:phosphonate transport system substrate-binding protein
MKRILLLALGILAMTAASAHAAQTFILGFPPMTNVQEEIAKYKILGDYLQSKLGLDVQYRPAKSYDALVESMVKKEIDGAFGGSFNSIVMLQITGADTLVTPDLIDGGPTYTGLLFTRKDTGIKTLADAKGKVLALVSPTTTGGYLWQMGYFKEKGIDPEKHFSKILMTGSHSNAPMAVYNKEAEIGGGKDTVFYSLAAKDPKFKETMVVLAEGPKVPANGLTIRKDYPAALQTTIRDTFLGMEKDPAGQAALAKFGAKRFIPTKMADYQPIIDMAAKIGLDLKNYKYGK